METQSYGDFYLGAKVKVIKEGRGVGISNMGKETIITHLGTNEYAGRPAAKVKDLKNSAFHDWIDLASFELIKTVDLDKLINNLDEKIESMERRLYERV